MVSGTHDERDSHSGARPRPAPNRLGSGQFRGIAPLAHRPTQRDRLALRDALDLPSRRPAFEDALRSAGFDVEACGPALAAFAHPSEAVAENPTGDAADALAVAITHGHVRTVRRVGYAA